MGVFLENASFFPFHLCILIPHTLCLSCKSCFQRKITHMSIKGDNITIYKTINVKFHLMLYYHSVN